MSERFNSGLGGYTCDLCEVLLWSGIGGLDRPERRQYIYSLKEEDLAEVNHKAYCGKECADAHQIM